MNATIAERVAKGAALLEEKLPGWWQRIDLDTLQMHDCWDCVVGQLFADAQSPDSDTPFGNGVWALGIQDAPSAFGFDGTDIDALNAEWKRVITERRAAA